jgi:hypothetical protein
MDDVRLRPHPVTLGFLLVLPVTMVVVGLAVSREEAGTLLLAVAGAVLAVRALRVRVDGDAERVAVHNMLRTRRIRRAAITRVRDDTVPALEWTTRRGRTKATWLTAFSLTGKDLLPAVSRHDTEALTRLTTWATPRPTAR